MPEKGKGGLNVQNSWSIVWVSIFNFIVNINMLVLMSGLHNVALMTDTDFKN